MKVILKNSGLVFVTPGIVAGTYLTKDLCPANTDHYLIVDGIPTKSAPSNGWGSTQFIPIDRVESILVACTIEGYSTQIPGVLFFEEESFDTYIGCQYQTRSSEIIDILDTFTPPSNARYCIIQSCILPEYLPQDASITFN